MIHDIAKRIGKRIYGLKVARILKVVGLIHSIPPYARIRGRLYVILAYK